MDAFKIKKNGKVLDYRKAEILNLDDVRGFFRDRFELSDLRQKNRHVLATIQHDNKSLILKLSTTEGVGARTEGEKLWNEEFNKYSNNTELRVPKNFEDGYYRGNLYYLIMEKFDGPLLSGLHGENNITEHYLYKIIDFSEYIQTLPLNIPLNDLVQNNDHQKWFVEKTESWLEMIPKIIREQFRQIDQLLRIVQQGSKILEKHPRHGDFTPWHLIALQSTRGLKPNNEPLGLIDGEHAHSHGVEYYDICYFIQRVHSILGQKELAEKILNQLLKRGYDKEKLKTVLASRAIGGFLDESFNPDGDYVDEKEFAKWIIEL